MDVSTIHFTITDDKYQKSTITLYVDKAYQGITTERAAQQIAIKISRLIKGQITGISYTTPCTLPGEVGPNLTDSDIEEKALFALLYENGSKGGVSIPTFDEIYYEPHSTVVDPGYEFIQDFIEMLVNGPGVDVDAVSADHILVPFTDRRNSDILEVILGHEHFIRGR